MGKILRSRGVIFNLVLIIFCLHGGVQSQGESFCKITSEGQLGYCIGLKSQIRACPKLYSWLLNGDSDWKNLTKSICSKEFTSDSLKVCCPVEWYEEPIKTNANDCEYATHPNFQLLPHDSKCGYISLTGRIIGGQNANPGDFPWMARIGLRTKNLSKPEVIFSCSGTIINYRYILTAAHCIPKVQDGLKRIFVRLAETDDGVNPESITVDGYVLATSSYLDYEVEEIIIHPDYSGFGGSPHDIALIRIAEDINTTSSFTQPVCLPFVKEYSLEASLNEKRIRRQNATVCGWGKTDANNTDGSSILQNVEVPVLPNVVCRIVYKKGAPVTDDQMCAGGLKGMNSCSGDSGGPLTKIAKRDDPSSKTKSVRHYQLGIVSFGKTNCGRENEPVVYTKVASYLKWILNNIHK